MVFGFGSRIVFAVPLEHDMRIPDRVQQVGDFIAFGQLFCKSYAGDVQ